MFQMDITSGFIRWSVKVQYGCPAPKNPSFNKIDGQPKIFSENYIRIILTWQPVFMISQIWVRVEYHLRITGLPIFVIF